MNNDVKIPIWFWVVSLLAITWNGIGVLAFINEAMMSPEQFAELSEPIQEAYNSRPAWATAAFAVAVFAGLVGSILLIMRKKLSVLVLTTSLLGVVVQHTYSFLIAKMHTIVTEFNIIMAVVVLVIAIALVLFAKSRDQLGWFS